MVAADDFFNVLIFKDVREPALLRDIQNSILWGIIELFSINLIL